MSNRNRKKQAAQAAAKNGQGLSKEQGERAYWQMRLFSRVCAKALEKKRKVAYSVGVAIAQIMTHAVRGDKLKKWAYCTINYVSNLRSVKNRTATREIMRELEALGLIQYKESDRKRGRIKRGEGGSRHFRIIWDVVYKLAESFGFNSPMTNTSSAAKDWDDKKTELAIKEALEVHARMEEARKVIEAARNQSKDDAAKREAERAEQREHNKRLLYDAAYREAERDRRARQYGPLPT